MKNLLLSFLLLLLICVFVLDVLFLTVKFFLGGTFFCMIDIFFFLQ